jgi:FkbM family methyltransferase
LERDVQLDQFLQNTMLNITDYRDNSKLFPRTEDFEFLDYCLSNLHRSRSQLLQDLFVLYQLREKPNGFFVEFGATNGVDLSNTFLLEKRFQWQGILAEPARCWHDTLRQNRGCIVDTRCVWTKTGEVMEFNEVNSPEYSTINAFSDSDCHAGLRSEGEVYRVESISLIDLLTAHGAPKLIDYLSIDTEGSEIDILSAFDFDAFDIRIMTVEHNHTENREKIHALLRSKGYRRVFEKFSRWDDWYIRA